MTLIKTEPFNYQIEDMKFLLKEKRAALLHEPGVGKTFGVLLAITKVLETEGGKALIIVPPILLDTWYDKIHDYFDTTLKVLIYSGNIATRKKLNIEKFNIVLISFNLFQIDYNVIKESKFNYLVVDETKYIKIGEVKKSSKTKKMNRFGCVQAMAHKVKYLALMNGTPLTKNPVDAFHIIQLINSNVYVTKRNFMSFHAVYSSNESGFPVIIGWKNLDRLNLFLKACSRRLIKNDVLELPKKQLVIKQFSLGSSHQKKVKELWDYGFLELDEGDKYLEGMGLMMQVRQALINPSIVGLKEKSAYFEILEDLLEDLNGQQVIIFAHFHITIDLLRAFIAGKNKTFCELHGRIADKNKREAVVGFKAGKYEILIANAKSAGVGLDFQHCNNVIFFELDYEVDSFWQGQDRVHRPGQTKAVNIFVFVAKNTPAVDLFRAVKTNINYVEQVLKGKEDSSRLFNNRITLEEEQKWKIL